MLRCNNDMRGATRDTGKAVAVTVCSPTSPLKQALAGHIPSQHQQFPPLAHAVLLLLSLILSFSLLSTPLFKPEQ